MNCNNCCYNLPKDSHSYCTYEDGECVKISVLEKENAELETQIEKMKCCINDLVHLGEFNEHTDEEYFNYQVHEALNNAGQFIKEIKEND